MCGLAGFWDLRVAMEEGLAQKTIDAMTDSLTHRGPDDRGIWRDRDLGLALGHRRLSIVDLSAAVTSLFTTVRYTAPRRFARTLRKQERDFAGIRIPK
jgi:asparagine synthetase B (glutamine-hydrolysing)